MSDNFDFHVVCEENNLDPKKTSLHDAKCLYYGLPVGNSSAHDVKCAKLGLPVGKTSVHDVEVEMKERGISHI
jgi:hypothetical protein